MGLLALTRRNWITTTALVSSLSGELKQPRILPFRTLHRSPPAFRIPSFSSSRVSSPLAVSSDVLHDAGATAAVLIGAYSLVRGFDNLTRRNLIQQNLSRKLVHILSGLLFTMSWPIFSTSTGARYFASIVPTVNCLRLVINGLSLTKDEGLLKSLTREGKPEELLRGPLYYVLILILSAVIFWRESPVGLISLGMMCGGDGIADIMGRKFGSKRLPYNQEKSWVGSISMFIFGFCVSIGMLYYFSVLGYLELDWVKAVQNVALISLVATVVESLPSAGVVDDNISVPLMYRVLLSR
ncbi:probable phytol kinase 1, chloroplastic isoform X2 [Cucumis sativus]|uniref:probable phytol kinase 1, chloroplastic isoform X2 n=1 Tax=Cucumis sativus TaxID=3659 RepID=UPI0012F4867F|nr:probable phytol kinase 1, chloroplastic isoform X2 [Cucumis sativus]